MGGGAWHLPHLLFIFAKEFFLGALINCKFSTPHSRQISFFSPFFFLFIFSFYYFVFFFCLFVCVCVFFRRFCLFVFVAVTAWVFHNLMEN